MGFLLIFLGLGSREIVLANSLLLYSLSFTPYGAGPSLTSVPWSHGFDSISFQKEKSFCHCMKPCCLPDLPIHHPNTPTHPSFPKIYDKCWNEIRNCRECLTSLATCHWRTAPCIFLLVWHFHTSLISFCTFLLIGWLNLITFTLLCPMICNLGTSTQSIIFYNDSIMGLVTKNSPYTHTPRLFILTHEEYGACPR